MPSVQHVSARNGDVVLLVGTMKGAFVLRSNGARKKMGRRWTLFNWLASLCDGTGPTARPAPVVVGATELPLGNNSAFVR